MSTSSPSHPSSQPAHGPLCSAAQCGYAHRLREARRCALHDRRLDDGFRGIRAVYWSRYHRGTSSYQGDRDDGKWDRFAFSISLEFYAPCRAGASSFTLLLAVRFTAPGVGEWWDNNGGNISAVIVPPFSISSNFMRRAVLEPRHSRSFWPSALLHQASENGGTITAAIISASCLPILLREARGSPGWGRLILSLLVRYKLLHALPMRRLLLLWTAHARY